MKWATLSIWKKAFLIALIVPALVLGWFLTDTIHRGVVNGFNNLDCGFDFRVQCNAVEYFFSGWLAPIVFSIAGGYFVLALLITNYAALVITLKKRKSRHYLPVLIIGVILFLAGIIGWRYLQARY